MRFRRGLLLLALASGAGTACLNGGDDRRTGIVEVRLGDGPRTLRVNLEACNADHNVVEVSETAGRVTLTARTSDPPGGDDCSDGVVVTLEQDLGDRTVFDVVSNRELTVTPQ